MTTEPTAHDDRETTVTIDGFDVVDREIKITGAGDGLSKALTLHGRDIAQGDEVVMILRGVVGGAQFKPKDPDDLEGGGWVRIDNVKARSATFTDAPGVARELDKHEKAVAAFDAEEAARKKEEKDGLTRIPFDDGDDEGGPDAEQAAEDGATPAGLASVPDPS